MVINFASSRYHTEITESPSRSMLGKNIQATQQTVNNTEMDRQSANQAPDRVGPCNTTEISATEGPNPGCTRHEQRDRGHFLYIITVHTCLLEPHQGRGEGGRSSTLSQADHDKSDVTHVYILQTYNCKQLHRIAVT
jgi:hypothetical protein